MDTFKPPTDNLYKFMAIAGLVAIVAAAYYWNRESLESYFKRHELERQVAGVISEFHRDFGSKAAHKGLEGHVESNSPVPIDQTLQFNLANATTAEERDSVIRHLDLHAQQLRQLATFPDPSNEEQVKFWTSWYELSKEDFERSLDESNGPSEPRRINEKAVNLLPRFEQSLLTVYEIWALEDSFRRVEWTAIVAASVGFLLMVAGFILWYIRVQRFQDELLLLELRKSRSDA